MCTKTGYNFERLHVCLIPSSTKGITSPSGETNSSIFGSHPVARLMVSKGHTAGSCSLLRLRLCWRSSGYEVYLRNMSLPRTLIGVLVLEEAKLCLTLHC